MSPIPDGPAAEAGLRENDVLDKLNGRDVQYSPADVVAMAIRWEKIIFKKFMKFQQKGVDVFAWHRGDNEYVWELVGMLYGNNNHHKISHSLIKSI